MLNDSIETVARARVYPPVKGQGCGVLRPDGSFVETSKIMQGVHRGQPAPQPEDIADLPRLKGRYLFGGWLRPHFGHFLFESTARLWAVDRAGDIDGIVFVPFLRGNVRRVAKQYQVFLRMLVGDVPFAYVETPTEVAELAVPGLGFGYGRAARGSAAYRDMARARVAAAVPAGDARRVYISRSALPDKRGGVFGEPRIEALMEANGYTVIHPQRLPLEDQLTLYRGAERVVALDGSALHLAAYALPQGAQVGMIRRRSVGPLDAIVWHLESFADARVHMIDALAGDWVGVDQNRVDYTSIGALDFPRLERALLEAGLIERGIGMPTMTRAEIAAEIAAGGRGPMKPFGEPRGRT